MSVIEITRADDNYTKELVTIVTTTDGKHHQQLAPAPLEHGIFSSYREFEAALEEYSQKTFTIFNRRTSVKMPYKHVPLDRFPYCRLVYNCVHFGCHRTKGRGIRPHHSTFSLGCPVTLQLVYSRNLGAYKITKCILDHNHPTSAEIYKTYPKNRRMTNEEQQQVLEFLKAGVKTHVVVKFARDKFNKQISPKDISNLRTKYKLRTVESPHMAVGERRRSKRGSIKPVKSLKTYFNQSKVHCNVRQCYGTICTKKAFTLIDQSLEMHESTTHTVANTSAGDYYVKSILDSAMFTVGNQCNVCDCTFFKKYNLPCVHIFAVLDQGNYGLFHKSLIPDRFLNSGNPSESVIQLPTDGEVANPLDSEVQLSLVDSEVQFAAETVVELDHSVPMETGSEISGSACGEQIVEMSVPSMKQTPEGASSTMTGWSPGTSGSSQGKGESKQAVVMVTPAPGSGVKPSTSGDTEKDKAEEGSPHYFLVEIPSAAKACQPFLVNSYDHGDNLRKLKRKMLNYADKVATLPTELADRYTKDFHKLYTELLEERPYQSMPDAVPTASL